PATRASARSAPNTGDGSLTSVAQPEVWPSNGARAPRVPAPRGPTSTARPRSPTPLDGANRARRPRSPRRLRPAGAEPPPRRRPPRSRTRPGRTTAPPTSTTTAAAVVGGPIEPAAATTRARGKSTADVPARPEGRNKSQPTTPSATAPNANPTIRAGSVRNAS